MTETRVHPFQEAPVLRPSKFDSVQRNLIEKYGLPIYPLTGKSIDEIKRRGEIRVIGASESAIGLDLNDRSRHSEVALYTNSSLKNGRRTPAEMLHIINSLNTLNDIFPEPIPKVDVIIGTVADYTDLSDLIKRETGRNFLPIPGEPILLTATLLAGGKRAFMNHHPSSKLDINVFPQLEEAIYCSIIPLFVPQATKL